MKFEKFGLVWYCCLNNSFNCLNTTICISATLSHSHIFPKHLNNIIKNLLPNGSWDFTTWCLVLLAKTYPQLISTWCLVIVLTCFYILPNHPLNLNQRNFTQKSKHKTQLFTGHCFTQIKTIPKSLPHEPQLLIVDPMNPSKQIWSLTALWSFKGRPGIRFST